MADRSGNPAAHVDVVPASLDQSPILANLLELYAHDFSEFHDIALGEDGRFGYRHLSLYWSEPDRHPFLVRIDGKLGGFVLVKRGSEVSGNEEVWDVAEFFVMRGYRRRGVGTQVAIEVWNLLPGSWEVRVMESNTVARHFWMHAVSSFAGKVISPARIEKDGEGWALFSFESKSVA